jgi:hypothetical protein
MLLVQQKPKSLGRLHTVTNPLLRLELVWWAMLAAIVFAGWWFRGRR